MEHEVSVIMIPLPCQSHLDQLLHLSAYITSHNIPVHYLGSATHNRQAKLRHRGLKPNPISQIHFHDLPTPPFDSPDPDPNASDKTPMHLAPASYAYMSLRQPIGSFAREISATSRRVVIIYDRLIAEAARDAVMIQNAESYSFNCLSVFNQFYIMWEAMGKPFEVEQVIKDLPSVREFISEVALQFIVSANIDERKGDIHNTCRLIDQKYIDLMERVEMSGSRKQWAIRPSFIESNPTNKTENKHACLDWLDKQPPRSVIYVSFGTTTSFTDEAVGEIAIGLEESKKKFIWVVRDADKADIFSGERRRIQLPQGFEERVREDGIVVREWAPQLEILAHGSIGGFMSHCGWNSCMESMTMGVPIAAWPIHSDQPMNAIFVTEILRVGIMVAEWRKKEMVKAMDVKKVVERLMGKEEGDELRKRAEEVSEALKSSMEEGGEGFKEMEDFIAHITRSN